MAIRDAVKAGYGYVVLDGTLVPGDRVTADRPFYSGKHKRHGMNLQVIADPAGTSCGCPGRCPARCDHLVSGYGVPRGTVESERPRAGPVTCDHYQVLERPNREPGNLQIPKMEPRWREFFTRRRQRSRAAGQVATGERMMEPWMCNSARRKRWAARAVARTLNSSSP
jgi:hypothetical protein